VTLGDLASLKVHLDITGTVTETALGMQCISPLTNWKELLAGEFLLEVMPTWLSGISNFVDLVELRVTDVVPGTAADVVLPTFPGHAGTAGVLAIAPINCALVVSWRSDGIGRNTRGRSYLCGMPLNRAVSGKSWSGLCQSWSDDLAVMIMSFYGPAGGSDLARLVVISRGPHAAPLVPPVSFPITGYVLSPEIESMRKRLR
jgi:hypothetical protein